MDGNLENMQNITGKIKSLEIDKTLSKKGKCAESKAVGDALATKVSITDIVDDLTSVSDDKPLSANQGRLLKRQIDDVDPHYAENMIYGDTNVKDALNNTHRAIGYTSTKNYLPNTMVSNIRYGVSCTLNDDKSFTLNGTNTKGSKIYLNLVGDGQHYIYEEIAGLEDGVEYIISGCPSGGTGANYSIASICQKADGSTFSFDDSGNGNTFTHEKGNKYRIYIGIDSNVTITNVTFKPMIRKASEDATYMPHVSVKSEIGKIIVDENLSVTVKASTATSIKSLTNLARGTYIATLRAIGSASTYINGAIWVNGVEKDVNVSFSNQSGISSQSSVTSIFNINSKTDTVDFKILSGVDLTNRAGQQIRVMKIA